jgi:predicted nuclease of predicted toxin-antitoxin system
MKFLVDAQLPVRLARFLQNAGHDAIHTHDLPEHNATPDAVINFISIQEQRIVITKDSDFVQSFLLQNQPYKLLLITTGNIKNSDLESLFANHLEQLTELFESYSYIELSFSKIVIYQ